MKVRKLLALFLLLAVGAPSSFAQIRNAGSTIVHTKKVKKERPKKERAKKEPQQRETNPLKDRFFTVKLGASMPTGDWSAVRYVQNTPSCVVFGGSGAFGGAATGWTLGLAYQQAIPAVAGLNWVVSLDFLSNGLDSDLKQQFENYAMQYEHLTSVKFPRYINWPLLAGLAYNYPLVGSVVLYGEAALGIRFASLSKFYQEVDILGIPYSLEQKYKTDVDFAGRLEVGVRFAERFSLGISYYMLGSPSVRGTYETITSSTTNKGEFDNGKLNSMNTLLLRLGVDF